MGRYSIKNLEDLTGIKAHTIRAWENRYEIIQPKRTKTNIRYYDDSDLKLLLNISLLNRYGYKISQIAEMPEEQVRKAVLAVTEADFEEETHIKALTVSMIELDEERFDKIISNCFIRHGVEYTMLNIVFPFLNKVGLLWQTSSITPCHEHFISNLIRQKLVVAIDGQKMNVKKESPTYLLFLPENESHEMGLMFAHYCLRQRNYNVFYLGTNVPFEELKLIYDTVKPTYLLTMAIVEPTGNELLEYFKTLSESFPDSRIIASGQQVILSKEKIEPYADVMAGPRELINYIDKAAVRD